MRLIPRLRRFRLGGRKPDAAPLRAPAAERCESLGQFQDYLQATEVERAERHALESSLLSAADSFTVPGHCVVCERAAACQVGYAHCFDAGDGRRVPNWREHLTCPSCRLNNRMRAAFAFLGEELAGRRRRLYLTEQVTPLFRAASRRFASVVGSEFLRDGTPPGRRNAAGVLQEDLTRLSLPSEAFDSVGTFDVLEHTPDYRAALAHLRRCLRPGGLLVMTVPFALLSQAHVVRAAVAPDGSLRHLMEPEYHGDPLDPAGALCFYHFGWDLLDDLRRCGFAEAGLHFYWSRELAFLGGTQFVVKARR